MTGERRSTQYGSSTVEYVLTRRKRKTAEISVLPDETISVIAPLEAPLEKIETMLRARMRWVRRQQATFSRLTVERPLRHYVSGETHVYCGRRYRLLVRRGVQAGVSLQRGRLIVTSHHPSDAARTRELVDEWRRRRAVQVFHERIEAVLHRFRNPDPAQPTGLLIRRLEARWGSMTPTGKLVLNLDLINAPTNAIDYVIAHELCHRIEPHHGRTFWALLSTVMPDWQIRKMKLEQTTR